MNKHNSTKIVATISDQRCDIDFLQKVIAEGVNVVRLNSAHMDHTGFDRVIGNVRAVDPHVAILMDTKGPEIRTTVTPELIRYSTGERVDIIANPDAVTTRGVIAVNYPGFIRDVGEGALILIDDGMLEIRVLEREENILHCEVLNDAELGSRKSVNVPGTSIDQPSLTERDKDTILYSIRNGVDFIAHSFVRSKQDVLDIQKILDEHNSPIKIIAKIENSQGVENIEEILDAAYGIMVARGDLGIEIDMEKIPAIQASIIHTCLLRKKPVIVATQMLHTMITSPRPTRAEVSDVSGAILMNTDAVMLSGETAYGKYPVEAVKVMSRIIHEAETHKHHLGEARIRRADKEQLSVTSFLAKQTVKSVEKLGVKAIITDPVSGQTVRNLAAYRGKAPIYAICFEDRTCRELALSYGVFPFYQERGERASTQKAAFMHDAVKILLDHELLQPDDLVAYVGGTLFPHLGTTTLTINKAQDAIDFYKDNVKPNEGTPLHSNPE